MDDGIINTDTDRGRQLGFTSEAYEGYLWKTGNAIIISFIMSKKKGNFRKLVGRIHALGYSVKVPTPLGRMEDILKRNGYRHTVERFAPDDPSPCDVWCLDPPDKTVTTTTVHG